MNGWNGDFNGQASATPGLSFELGGGNGGDMTVNHIIAHGMRFPYTPSVHLLRTRYDHVKILNTIVYDLERNSATAGTAVGIGLVSAGSTADIYVLNSTVLNIENNGNSGGINVVSFDDDADIFIRNTIAMDANGTATGTFQDFAIPSPSNATVSNNMSSDTTASGTGSLTSKSASDQFESNTEGSEDLHLKSGADAIDAGTDLVTTPTGVNIDIDGRDRDAEGDTWDMGADEFVAAGGGAATTVRISIPTSNQIAIAGGNKLVIPELS